MSENIMKRFAINLRNIETLLHDGGTDLSPVGDILSPMIEEVEKRADEYDATNHITLEETIKQVADQVKLEVAKTLISTGMAAAVRNIVDALIYEDTRDTYFDGKVDFLVDESGELTDAFVKSLDSMIDRHEALRRWGIRKLHDKVECRVEMVQESAATTQQTLPTTPNYAAYQGPDVPPGYYALGDDAELQAGDICTFMTDAGYTQWFAKPATADGVSVKELRSTHIYDIKYARGHKQYT